MAADRPAPLVLIVAYGDERLLQEALGSLGVPRDQVVVVDNGLSDTARRVSAPYTDHYVRPPRNIGFAAGVNVGLRCRVEGQDVLLLNPDAAIAREDVLRLQYALHADDRLAAVAPELQNTNGKPEKASWPIPSPSTTWADAFGL